MARYDLVVLGSGPAGEKGAATAAAFGKKVAVVEKEPVVGGASANTGTLPSKTLRETAVALSGFRARDLYGVDLSLRREATIRDLMFHESHVKSNERERVLSGFQRGAVDVYRGLGSFVDAHTVAVGNDVRLEADKFLIATGSSPIRPREFHFEDPRIHDSDEILAIDTLPDRLAVIGAGVIGCEYACTFAALGCEVHLVDGRDIVLGFLDRELSTAFEAAMARLKITLHKKNKVRSCEVTDSGWVNVVCDTGLTLEMDQVLVAAGRASNTARLGLDAAGIKAGPKGVIEVNQFYQTSAPHVYAAGDVIGFPALSATSAEQGRLAMNHAFDLRFKLDMAPLLPAGIYTIPEISSVGETEESLQTKCVEYVVGRAGYADNARGEIIGDRNGFLKLLFGKCDMKLLGVHVIGEHASEVVHVGMMVMLAGGGADILNRACFNYPTLGDLYKTATYQALKLGSC